MVKVKINGQEHYYDEVLTKNLDLLKEAVEKKWDGIIYVGGYEGDGKSELSAQIAYYLDPTYNLSRCVFTPKQFLEAVDNAKAKEAIVYDEAQDAFESINKDKMARVIKSKMTRIRKKQLYIIIVAPDFWRINKYLFIHRSRAFLRAYANGLDRGFFEFYNRTKKHELMIRGKKNEQLCVPPNFRGRYTHWFPLDSDAYEKKKDDSTESIQLDGKLNKLEERAIKKHRAEGMYLVYKHMSDSGLINNEFSMKQLSKLAGFNPEYFYKPENQFCMEVIDETKRA